MSARQYARLVDEWVTGIGLRSEDCGTHSLRRTKAAIIYKQTGNLPAVQILFGHAEGATRERPAALRPFRPLNLVAVHLRTERFARKLGRRSGRKPRLY